MNGSQHFLKICIIFNIFNILDQPCQTSDPSSSLGTLGTCLGPSDRLGPLVPIRLPNKIRWLFYSRPKIRLSDCSMFKKFQYIKIAYNIYLNLTILKNIISELVLFCLFDQMKHKKRNREA